MSGVSNTRIEFTSTPRGRRVVCHILSLYSSVVRRIVTSLKAVWYLLLTWTNRHLHINIGKTVNLQTVHVIYNTILYTPQSREICRIEVISYMCDSVKMNRFTREPHL
jgi:hypothetical protein